MNSQVEHREVHNIYGYCHHKATYDGMIKRDTSQNIRPHVLTRSFFAGSQKWAVVWTGDTGATWDHLRITVPQLLSLSLCGNSNCGGNVCGFAGDSETELAIRWYQLSPSCHSSVAIVRKPTNDEGHGYMTGLILTSSLKQSEKGIACCPTGTPVSNAIVLRLCLCCNLSV